MRLRVARGARIAACLAGLALVVASCADSQDGVPEPAELLAVQVADGVPVVVPKSLPSGYEYWNSSQQRRGDEVVAASWMYRPTEGPGKRPAVEVCAEPTPAAACNGDVVHEDVAGLYVTVSAAGPTRKLGDEWRSVRFVRDLREADWLEP